jgi:hypothetical protein
MNTCTPSEQTRRDDSRIVENQELIASQKSGKLGEHAVFESS